MARNVEIKARIADRTQLIDRVQSLQPHETLTLQQKDTFFKTPQGRLKLREFPDGHAELIYYHRPDHSGPKLSTYSRCPVSDAGLLRTTLEQAYGITGTVEKTRQVFLVGQTRVHVDQVKHLGDFMELEVVLTDEQSAEDGQLIAQQLMHDLGISSDQLIESAYMDLLLESISK